MTGGSMTGSIMIQGTMSNAGKTLVTAGLCRIFREDGYRPAPFKSQNMALNSFITQDGLEMGRAQVMQAEAAGIEPSVLMNPILLKPTSDMGSQVIVNGEVVGTMSAAAYFAYKNQLRPVIMKAYGELAAQYDIIVIEGAGSPAEINLNSDDIVNMGMAQMADAPVLLVGDIDRGGVFASVYGTLALLNENERSRVKGIIINKFRGDIEILRPGLAMLEKLTNVPVLGVVPYLHLDIDDEDSLSDRFRQNPAQGAQASGVKPLDIAVIHLPHISNFTDFNALSRMGPVGLRYVDSSDALKNPDLIILPGTKNTMEDLIWLRQNGLEAAVKKHASEGTLVIGICGGYQMLGMTLLDPDDTEQCSPEQDSTQHCSLKRDDPGKCGHTKAFPRACRNMRGMELLPVSTVFAKEKVRTRVSGQTLSLDGGFAPLSRTGFEGYEIHMGRTTIDGSADPFAILSNGVEDGAVSGNIFGSYLHGLFDGAVGLTLIQLMLSRKGIEDNEMEHISTDQYKDRQYGILADALRESLDMEQIYRIVREGHHA